MKQLKINTSERRVSPYWFNYFRETKEWDQVVRQIIHGLPVYDFSIPFMPPNLGIDTVIYELKDEFPEVIKLLQIQL